MEQNPYFITWTKQNKALTFDIEKSKDSYYIRSNGMKVLDLCSTSYHSAFGHSYTPIKKAIKKQLDSLPIASPKSTFDLKKKTSLKLLEALKLKGKIFYTVSGAESIENALKIARHQTGKQIILARKNSYHGATLGALSLTGDWRNSAHKTVDQWTKRIPEPSDDPNGEKLEALILKTGAHKIAAICLETITGGNGVIIPPNSWWKAIKRIQKKYGILLILDEVVCGFGRTGENFGFQHFNIRPDIVCMAKIITGGYIPFGAVYVNTRISKFYNNETLSCGLTNYAHPLGLSAMNSVLDELKRESLSNNMSSIEKELSKAKSHFNTLQEVKECRSVGLLMAIELKESIGLDKFLDRNLLLASVGNNLILAPTYIVKVSELRKAFKLIEEIIKENS